MTRPPRCLLLTLLTALLACATRPAVTSPPSAEPPASTLGTGPAVTTPVSPTLRLPMTVWPTGYTAELTVDPNQPTFHGVLDIALDVKEPAEALWLLGHALTVKEAELTVGGVKVALSQVKGEGDFLGFVPAQALAVGPANLRLVYEGALDERELSGAFRTREGDDWYVFTQFEPLGARRVFPCFDEPGFKVPWQLTFHVPEGLKVVTNTPGLGEEKRAGGGTTWRFGRTRPLPSYLVAFGVGPFDVLEAAPSGQNAVPTRIVTPRGRAAEAAHAARETPGILAHLERYFGIPYPYEKLDVLAVPLLGGAMENPGLVTFNSELILSKPEEDSIERQRRFFIIQAHELGHQWFGNLVTMAWWDDLWLNESFANWAETHITTELRPAWDLPLMRVRTRSRALGADSLVSARRIRQPIQSENDIRNAFDGITYGKGGAVLYMIEQWLGPETFRGGVRRYLLAHENGNATAKDFLATMSAESRRDVTGVMSTFLEQGGAPLITARLDCAGAVPEVELSQKRYLPLGSTGSTEQLWKVPVCVRFGTKDASARACTLLETAKARLPLTGAKGCPTWLHPNADAAGYYRTAVDARMLSRLLSTEARQLSRAERVALLGDVNALVNAGEMPAADALGLLPGLAGEKDRLVFEASLDLLNLMEPTLLSGPRLVDRERFLRDTYGARARALGFVAKEGEDADTRLLRPRLLRLAGTQGGDPRLMQEARALTERWLTGDTRAIDPELVEVTLSIAARGDVALYERFLKALREKPERKRTDELISALGGFRQAELVQRNLALLLEPEMDVRELGMLLFTGASYESSREVTLDFVMKHYDELVARMPEQEVSFLAYLTSFYCDPVHRQEMAAFFTERMARAPGGPRTLATALEQVDLCIAYKAAQGPSVESFLTTPRRASAK